MWQQDYAPIGGSVAISALAAAIPLIVLFLMLGVLRKPSWLAAMAALASGLLVALAAYGMPAKLAVISVAYGAAYGIFPIAWVVFSSIMLYRLVVDSGKFEIIKNSVGALTGDRRLQALFIAFAFGAFIEGAAGFGTPVAISAAMLIGLGFKPLAAAGLALIGNTAPVAYGALGTPIITLAKVTGLNEMALSAMVGRQLPLFSLIVPFWLIWQMSGFKGMVEVWPACLVAGLSFAIPQFLVSNYWGPNLVDIIAAAVSIFAVYVLLKFWQPAHTWRFPDEREEPHYQVKKVSGGEAFMAWMPWIVLSVLVFIWGMVPVKNFLNGIFAPKWELPGLHNLVFKGPPVSPRISPEAAVYILNLLSATGTGLMVSGIISGLWLGFKPAELVATYWNTLKRVRMSLLTIAAMLALGYTTKFSASDSTMGLAFASTGVLFPFFSPLLGWLGVALTGSDTSSNVLFGNLQVVSAQQIGMNPILAAASNSSGGVMGKMIDAQSIVVASVATNQHGKEGEILRYVFWHSLALACLVGVLVFVQHNFLGWMVPIP